MYWLDSLMALLFNDIDFLRCRWQLAGRISNSCVYRWVIDIE